MSISHITLTAPNTYTAEIDGMLWSGITPSSRFYPAITTAIAGGAEVITPPTVDALTAWRASAKVSRFQAFAALSAAGKLTDATAAVNAAGGVAKLAWDNAIEFRRNSPTIAGLASAVGLDDAALDALFIAAAEIEA